MSGSLYPAYSIQGAGGSGQGTATCTLTSGFVGTVPSGFSGISQSMNSSATTWNNAVVTAGGTVSNGRLISVSNLITGLNAIGVWSSLIRLWMIAAENPQAAIVDLVAADTNAFIVGSPTFTVDRGYATTGSADYINTGYAPASPYTLNNASFGFALRVNKVASVSIEMGNSNSSGPDYGTNISVKYIDNNMYFGLNDDNSDAGRAGPTDTSGVWIISRTGSTTASAYQAGSLFATNSRTSTTLPTYNFPIGGGFRTDGTFLHGSLGEFTWGMIGQGLTAQQVADLSVRVKNYLTAIGA